MKTTTQLAIVLVLFQVLVAAKCKKDYYTGTENVRLSATLNNTNEALNVGDTLKIRLVVPASVTSETSQTVTVHSVQRAQYNFVFYQLDTLTKAVTRIRNATVLSVSEGSIDSYLGAVFCSTAAPFQSVLNIVPPAKGVYYVQFNTSGSLKLNNSYESFLKVNFAVPDKHWNMYNTYVPGFSTSPDVIHLDSQGYGWYCFKVK